jgi:hypothetical protein
MIIKPQGAVKVSWLYIGSMICLLLFILTSAAQAMGATSSGAISQGYRTNTVNITQGSLVSLASTDSNVVEPANSTTNVANLVGISENKPLLELSGGSSNSLQVVVSGSTKALVSNVNGPVNAGDRITASPISGIGMKAIDSTEVVGTAQANLSSVPTISKTVVGKNGEDMTIKIGLLPVAVTVTYYAASASSGIVASFIPPFLQDVANALTGKQVSPLRVLLGGMALLLGFIAVIVMLYVSIKSGVISLGRNPLAKDALQKGLVDVLIAALGVLIVTIILVYAILSS